MKEKIDTILAKIKEPTSGLSLLDLNLVTNIRYSEKESAMLITTDNYEARQKCYCVGMMNAIVRKTIIEELEKEFKATFSHLSIQVE